MTYVGAFLAADAPAPADLVPDRYRPRAAESAPAAEATPAEREAAAEADNRAAWRLMHQFFRGRHGG